MTRDISGYEIFSAGDLGVAHSMAHQMLDLGRYEQGHRRLGQWLAGRDGRGSEWIHLQWHMLVFELAVGRRTSALARMRQYIAPAAASGSNALTDAPAALWRLALAGERAELPWDVVRARAAARIDAGDEHYVVLHHLLAFAGAGDVAAIDRWLIAHAPRTARDDTLERMALGLRCFAARDFAHAAAALAAGLPGVADLGGSRAQNEMFADIYRVALSRGTSINQQGENHGNRYL